MENVKSRLVKKYDRSIPNISFENEGIILRCLDLVNNNMNIYHYMGVLFLNFGFKPKDNIFLCNYNVLDNSVDCILNNEEKYVIQFDKDKIYISIHNSVYGYDCEKVERSELGVRVSLESYTYKYDDGITFTRKFSRNDAKFIVSICGYMIELELDKPDFVVLPLYDNSGCFAKYRLENEQELINYMISPKNIMVPIVELYKQLEKLYFQDIFNYPRFCLKISNVTDDSSLNVLGLIDLKYGEMEKFGITDNKGRIIFLDNKGNWNYTTPKEEILPVTFSMSNYNGNVSFSVSCDETYNLSDEYIFNSINNDINVAIKKIDKTKLKIRELFGSKRDKNV